jgi:hypothetical protein
MEPVFEDGFPARITPADFRRYHLQSFPRLAESQHDGLVQEAIDTVYDAFYGVATIWNCHSRQTWCDKTRTCYRLLTAWFIADLYPSFVAGTPVMGGLPLKRKKIDGVDLTFQDMSKSGRGDYQNLLAGLDSNPFGKTAKIMITTSAARFRLRSHPKV